MSRQNRDSRHLAGTVALYGLLIALAFIFSYVEAMIPFPVPIPGIKLGLANLVNVVGLYTVGAAGTAAVAMRDGVVESVGETVPGMGRYQILIRHEDGSAILYGHLQNGTLQPGDTVKQGEKIGECSDSGDTWVAGVGVIYYSASSAK